MKGLSFAKVVALVAAVALVASASPASAATKAEGKCQATIAKTVTKHASTIFKTISGCHKGRNSGKKVAASVNCNDPDLADTKGKLGKARTKFLAGIGSSLKSRCTDKTGAPLIAVGPGSNYPQCPAPSEAIDDGGATTGIDDLDELAACLLDLTEKQVSMAAEEILGLPDVPLGKLANKCAGTLAKIASKQIGTIGKVRSKCQGTAYKANNTPGDLTFVCATDDSAGKIAGGATKAKATIDKSCNLSMTELNSIDSCGDTPTQLKNCVIDRVATQIGGGLLAAAYELPATCNTNLVQISINAGAGEQITETRLSSGWTGLGHGADVVDGYTALVDLVNCTSDCSVCEPRVNFGKNEPFGGCRCNNTPTVHCDVINGPDFDDCGGATCDCMFGPPLALAAGGQATCIVNRIAAELVGTANLGIGASSTQVQDEADVYLGIDQLSPCPTCDGDVTMNDGIADGTCNGGRNAGQPCDASADGANFGIVSYDCQPSSGSKIATLNLDIQLESADQSHAFNLPCDIVGNCPCRICSANSARACASNADCGAGEGTCTASGGAGVNQDACNGGPGDCVDGECSSGPFDTFCDGITRSNGNGYIGCNTNADCATLGAGNCGTAIPRPCYNDPIVNNNDGGPFGALLGSVFCAAPTGNGAVDFATGQPGASQLQLDFDFEARCASNADVVYWAPGGSNCP